MMNRKLKLGLSGAVLSVIIAIGTLALMVTVFVLYSSYIGSASSSTVTDSSLVGLSSMIHIHLSTISYHAYPPSYRIFNVSYLFVLNAPIHDNFTIIIFKVGETPLSELYYTLPDKKVSSNIILYNASTKLSGNPNSQGASALKVCYNYNPIKNFTLSDYVYVPQDSQNLGYVTAYAYNVTPNTTYILSTNISLNNIVVIWVLFSHLGKLYRVGYTYNLPSSLGLGLLVVGKTGTYSSNSKNLPSNGNLVHTVTTNKGDSFGFWFYVFNTRLSYVKILNLTFFSTTNGKTIYIILYMTGGYLNVYVQGPGSQNGQTNYTFSSKLYEGIWYFLNVSQGAILNLQGIFKFTLYNLSGLVANPICSEHLSTTLNGYDMAVSFGSNNLAVGISQAYFVSLQSQSLVPQFYNTSSTVYNTTKGPYYNNTKPLYEIIESSNGGLYSIAYWFFVNPTSTAPESIDGYLWYYTNSGLLQCVLIPESGTNTYYIV